MASTAPPQRHDGDAANANSGRGPHGPTCPDRGPPIAAASRSSTAAMASGRLLRPRGDPSRRTCPPPLSRNLSQQPGAPRHGRRRYPGTPPRQSAAPAPDLGSTTARCRRGPAAPRKARPTADAPRTQRCRRAAQPTAPPIAALIGLRYPLRPPAPSAAPRPRTTTTRLPQPAVPTAAVAPE
nr:uncharacterized protein LOC127309808 [Lolium perenne]